MQWLIDECLMLLASSSLVTTPLPLRPIELKIGLQAHSQLLHKLNMPNSPAESPLKSSSNITDFVQRMTQAYKRKPSKLSKRFEFVSDDSNPTDGDASSSGGGGSRTPSRSNRSTEFDAEALNTNIFCGSKTLNMASSPAFLDSPSPLATLPDPSLMAVRVQVLETLVMNIFATLSSLKSSYAQLQSAHSPYDVIKHEVADKAVISEIRRLSDLKHSYLERDAIVSGQSVDYGDPASNRTPQLISNQQPPSKETLSNSLEGIMSNYHSEMRKKDAELESLKDMLAESSLQREKLEKNVNRLEEWIVKEVSPVNVETSSMFDTIGPTPLLLESAVKSACAVSKAFTKLLLSLMKAAQWDLDAASDSIEMSIHYAKRSHQKYAFESYVCQQMWNGFENDSFYIFGSLSSILDPEKHRKDCFDEYLDMKELDPLELISVNPDSVFGKFCHKKFLQLVHPKMETSFFGNFEHRNQITEGSHPNSQFYQSFLRLAKAVWLVHKLAFAYNPTASIFLARRGTVFSPACMESVVPGMEIDENHDLAKVGLTVMPGFRVDKLVIKCQVYLEALEGCTE